MHIETVNAYHVTLPFKTAFANARFQAQASNVVVVEVVAEGEDIRGYGEGLPIESVTGETPERAMQRVGFLCRHRAFPWELEDVSQVWQFIDRLPPTKTDNAAICALETALLDALGKALDKTLIDFLPQNHRTDRIYYGAPLTLGDKEKKRAFCQTIKAFGMQHVRAKMDARFARNRETLEAVAEAFDGTCFLRIDPNGTWNHAIAVRHLPLIRQYRVNVVEEPFPAHDDGFKDFCDRLRDWGVGLMACESAPTLTEIQQVVQAGYYTMVNVKLSRSGGFRRSLRMIDHLRANGLAFQIGCSTGESGILSAAGRALGLACRDAVTYDGSYDAFLLQANTTCEDVGFGPGGAAGVLAGSGLGVAVNRDRLERLSGRKKLSVTREGI
jgi:L-alanine-DL-glutamate epimerase-like enolase superfamily enzyme